MAHERRKGALISNLFFHPAWCIWLATRQERRNLLETAFVLLWCLSPTSPLLYWTSNDPKDNKVLFWCIIKLLSSLPLCFSVNPVPFSACWSSNQLKACHHGRFNDGRSFLHAALRPKWSPLRPALPRLVSGDWQVDVRETTSKWSWI